MNRPASDLPHVVIVITKGDVGGAQNHVLSLVRGLAGHFRFTIVCGEHDYLTRQARSMGVPFVLLDSLRREIAPLRDYGCYRDLCRLLRQLQPDLVHLHSSKAGLLGRLAAWKIGVPSLFTAHGWAFTEGAGLVQRSYGLVLEWIMARIGNGIITVSAYDMALARKWRVVRGERAWCIRNAVEEAGQPVVAGDGGGDVVLLNVGRMARAKNHLLLLEAAARLEGAFRLVIVGRGRFYPQLLEQADRLGLQQRVTFVTDNDDPGEWFRRADIYVLSSDYEGLPLSVLEAMAAGLPVISTRVGGVPEAVTHDETGLLVDRGDVAGLARSMQALVDDREQRRRLGEAGYRRFEEEFRVERLCGETLEVYRSLLG